VKTLSAMPMGCKSHLWLTQVLQQQAGQLVGA
jgi:hypothetical protein